MKTKAEKIASGEGPGRPRVGDRRISAVVTHEQWEFVCDMADDMGIEPSEFIRVVLDNEAVRVKYKGGQR